MVKSLVFLAVLAVFLSFGRHFSLVYDLFFNFAPGFNKFRVPSMILILVEFIVAVLAGYGINDILHNKKENLFKVVLINFGIFLGIGLLVLAFSGQFSYSSLSDRYANAQLDVDESKPSAKRCSSPTPCAIWSICY